GRCESLAPAVGAPSVLAGEPMPMAPKVGAIQDLTGLVIARGRSAGGRYLARSGPEKGRAVRQTARGRQGREAVTTKIIVNPMANKGTCGKRWPQIRAELEKS